MNDTLPMKETKLRGVVRNFYPLKEIWGNDGVENVIPASVQIDVSDDDMLLFRSWFIVIEDVLFHRTDDTLFVSYNFSRTYSEGEVVELSFSQFYEAWLDRRAYEAQTTVNAMTRRFQRQLSL